LPSTCRHCRPAGQAFLRQRLRAGLRARGTEIAHWLLTMTAPAAASYAPAELIAA
jgi:hypothetical protein